MFASLFSSSSHCTELSVWLSWTVFCVGGQAAHTFCYLCNLQSSNSFSSNVNVISFSYSMLIVLSGWMEYECKPLHLDLPSNLLQLPTPLWIFLFPELWISRSNAKRFFPRGQFDCNSLWTFSQPWLSYNKRFLHHRFHRCQYSQELLGLFFGIRQSRFSEMITFDDGMVMMVITTMMMTMMMMVMMMT